VSRFPGRRALAAVWLTIALLSGCSSPSVDTTVGSAEATAPPQSAPASGSDAPAEQRMARAIFDRVNAEREARGLEPLAWNEELAGVARQWSEQMASQDRLHHQDLTEVLQGDELSGFRALGENIFTATGPVPAGRIHVGWMRSDEHRVNVLNPGFNRIGIGVYCAEDGSVWAAQEFGRTVGADRPSVATSTPPEQPITRPEPTGPSCG